MNFSSGLRLNILIALTLVITIWMIPSPCYSQYDRVSPGLSSLDAPIDARSVALGESFTARKATLAAYLYNPAALAGISGVEIAYAHRGFDIFRNSKNPPYFRSYTGALHTPLADVGIFYRRFGMEELMDAIPEYPEGTGARFRAFDYTYGITIARRFTENFSAGITVKTLDHALKVGDDSDDLLTHNFPVIFDIGILHSIDAPLLSKSIFADYFSIGMSLQNFGTDYRPKLFRTTVGPGTVGATPTPVLVDGPLIKLPRYLRLGILYSIASQATSEKGNAPIIFHFSAEYRNLLNAADSQEDDRDYWGFGTETTFFELVSLRIGGYISPGNGIYGSRGTPALRYGAGIHLPLRRLNMDVPLTIVADYGVIPLNNSRSLFYSADRISSTFRLYSVNLHYTNDLF